MHENNDTIRSKKEELREPNVDEVQSGDRASESGQPEDANGASAPSEISDLLFLPCLIARATRIT